MTKIKSFLVNDSPNYRFAELVKMPETQLVMLAPVRLWQRLGEYINTYESISLAGRFGADPGDYEWEWLADPEAVRWFMEGRLKISEGAVEVSSAAFDSSILYSPGL